MSLLTTGTVLGLSGITLRDYSARQLKVEVEPIDPGSLVYDANGTLHDLTMIQFRKYQFTLTCEATDAPVLDDAWKGKLVTITLLPGTGLSLTSEDEGQSFDCMLSSWKTNVDEWGAATGWSIVLMER